MVDVGVVGAGAGAAALSYVVDGAHPSADLTVLEKSGGVCGRAATRRHGSLTYDYGANYLKSDDERVADLVRETLGEAGRVDVTEPIYTFDGDGTVSEGRDTDEHRWSYESGLTQIAKRLFAETDATVHRRTRVEAVRRLPETDQWELTDADGRQWGPFDALALNPPAPQTAALLDDAQWDHPVRERLAAAAKDVPYRTIWTAVLHYEFELDRPYYALINTDDDHDVGWIAREECKRGHVPDGESLLVVQASPEWSADNYDDDPADNVAELAELTAAVVGDDRLTEPDWTDHQGWRYALPDAGVQSAPVDSANEHGLYPVGDWVAGEARLHAALRNGLDVGERLAYAL
ncbi:NAD(P)-binding protein [Halomicrobium sp. IBSBa]|uniref:NAD(P)/FAD-dependent oxidoreductase n=1 Tax=Halomicrobium sp. IBSBa TaxID=2778916 RepID=UPI001ABF3736|nr:NAD(P)-binding protein [Halomicrobium sp. IBSBa]MBO4248429.1 NAD(P)-binding protein [Halomicrobium sp. IBSBa]